MPDPVDQPSVQGRDPYTEEVILPSGESPLAADPSAVSPSELQASFSRLVLLYNLGHQICAETDERRVFEAILSAVSTLLNVERAFIAVVSDGRLSPRAGHDIDLGPQPDDWPVSTTMLSRVLREGIALLTTDALHDAQFGEAPSVDLHNIRSVICCPLGPRHQPEGLIYADNRVRCGAFSRADLEFLSALAHYAFLAIENARQRRRSAAEKELAEARLDTLRRDMAVRHDVVSVNRQMVHAFGLARRAARSDLPVVVVGETGTGKEVFARLIHDESPRKTGPFVPVHIGALPNTLVESELFGHEKGAFTGADSRRIGRFELARGGTLLLDEIQDIPAEVQPKLLRVLEERCFSRLGSNESIKADVRVVCACNRPPEQYVAEGVLRPDLHFRLSAVSIEIPPLRERREDIVPLVRHFLTLCGSEKRFDDEALSLLAGYGWPGNVRELRNCIEALDVLVDGPVITRGCLPPRMQHGGVAADALHGFERLAEVVARVEREHIVRALELAGGNNEEAIRLLGIARDTFFRRKKKYGL